MTTSTAARAGIAGGRPTDPTTSAGACPGLPTTTGDAVTTEPTPDRPEVDDPRVLALAKARQQRAHNNPFNAGFCPPWDGLTEQEQRLSLLDARNYLRAAIDAGLVSAVSSPPAVVETAPAGRDALRDRIAEALIAWTYRGKDPEHSGILETVRANAYSRADAVLAMLPPPVDRAAVLREAEGALRTQAKHMTGEFNDSDVLHEDGPAAAVATWNRAADQLRRMADEAQQQTGTETHPAHRETVEYFLQAQQDDGTWEDASSFMNALEWATERLAAKRAKFPGFSWRMAQRITTVTVQPVPDCPVCRHWRCDGDGPCGALVDARQRCTCTGPSAAVSQPGKEH